MYKGSVCKKKRGKVENRRSSKVVALFCHHNDLSVLNNITVINTSKHPKHLMTSFCVQTTPHQSYLMKCRHNTKALFHSLGLTVFTSCTYQTNNVIKTAFHRSQHWSTLFLTVLQSVVQLTASNYLDSLLPSSSNLAVY